MKKLLFFCVFLLMISPSYAQDDNRRTEVSIEASDGLVLIGDLIVPDGLEADAPAVLLMHMVGGRRADYEPLLPYLIEAGFIVLNVDLRGHAATGGSRDWELAEADVQIWLNWLREQDDVDATRVATLGASIGSNLALLGCAKDDACVTAIALSPGLDYFGVVPAESIENGLDALLIASHRDRESADSIREFFSIGTGYLSARMYEGSAHGTRLFQNDLESVAHVTVAWLDELFAAVESDEA